MAKTPTSKKRTIKGHDLNCTVCKNDTFWERETLMNTPKMSFFNLDWLNKKAKNYICDNCGHVLWFMNKN
jgi:hypothetical protein